MLLVLFIVLFFICAFVLIRCYSMDVYVILEDICSFIMVVCAIGIISSVIIIILNHLGINGTVAAKQQEYDLLVYQLDNNMYHNDNDLGLKETMNEVKEYNTDLAFMQALQHDLWLGIYIPNIYDQFEFIDLDKLR